MAEFVKLKRDFLDQMNRRGYFYPTDLTFVLSLHSWRFLLALRTHPEGRSVLSDNIDPREAFAQALVLSSDEDPNAVMPIWGQFSANLQENCVVPIQHILRELCE